MQFKIGDKIRIKAKDELLKDGWKEQLYGLYIDSADAFVTNGMYAFLGQTATIKDKVYANSYVLSVDCARYIWNGAVLEKLNKFEDVTVGDLTKFLGKEIWYYDTYCHHDCIAHTKIGSIRVDTYNVGNKPQIMLVSENGLDVFNYDKLGKEYFFTKADIESARSGRRK